MDQAQFHLLKDGFCSRGHFNVLCAGSLDGVVCAWSSRWPPLPLLCSVLGYLASGGHCVRFVISCDPWVPVLTGKFRVGMAKLSLESVHSQVEQSVVLGVEARAFCVLGFFQVFHWRHCLAKLPTPFYHLWSFCLTLTCLAGIIVSQ